MAKMSALKNVFLLLSQVATGLGLCTLVAEDDILVSSPVLCFLIEPCHITSFVLQKMCWKLYICTSGCARHHGVLRELVHVVLREAGRYLSFDQSPDESAAHQRSALLGSAADHLLRQSNQRNTTKVRHFAHSYLPIFGFFFAMFYSLTHILSCTDFCPNFQGCWRVTMSIWGLLQEKQSLCFLSWPETWTRWVLFKGIPLSSSVCVLLSFICVRPNIFIPLFFFFFSCLRSLILTNWTNSATNWMHWPQTVTSTEPRRTRKSNDLCSGTFSRLLRWVGVRQIRFVGIWSQLAHGKNSLLFYRRATSSPRPFDLGPSVWPLTAGSERGCMMPSGSLWALEWTITCRCIF